MRCRHRCGDVTSKMRYLLRARTMRAGHSAKMVTVGAEDCWSHQHRRHAWFAADLDLCRFDAVAPSCLRRSVRRISSTPGAEQARGGARGDARGIANVTPSPKPAVRTTRLRCDRPALDRHCRGARRLLPFRCGSRTSRLGKLPPPIDGVTTAIDDAGAGGRPAWKRLASVQNSASIPNRQRSSIRLRSSRRKSRGRSVWSRLRRSGGAAVAVDGRMIDTPVIGIAEQILRSLER